MRKGRSILLQKVYLAEFSPRTRTVTAEQSPDAVILTLCARSYLVSGTLLFLTDRVHILVGKYSSLAHSIDFYVGINHDYRALTTYPLSTILSGNTLPNEAQDDYNRHQIIIGNDVWIGGDVRLMGGVHIGNGAVIGAGAVVAKDVPPYAIVVGNPARVIKYRFDEETIARLQRIKWWNWKKEDIERYIPEFNNDMAAFLDQFDPGEQQEESDETAVSIRALRADGFHVSYFIPDFEIAPPYAVWPCVIDSFLAAYTAEDKAALVLAMPDVEGVDNYAEAIASRITEFGECAPLVLSHPCTAAMPFSIAALKASSAYITTREAICSSAVDYAGDAGLTIRYGLDQGVLLFPSV